MNATHGEQPVSAGAPPIPMTLRAIAAWLESHPAAIVHHIDTVEPGLDPGVPIATIVRGYLGGDDPDLYGHARLIGDGWIEQWRVNWLGLEWQIAPGVVYRLTDARV